MSPRKLRSQPTFFIDRSLGGPLLAEALRAVDANVVTQHEVFLKLGILPQDEKDEVWLEECGKNGWTVLTKDSRIKTRAIEREAFVRAGVGVFVLKDANMDGEAQRKAIVTAYPRMVKMVQDLVAPFMARIGAMGAVVPIGEVQRRSGVKKQ